MFRALNTLRTVLLLAALVALFGAVGSCWGKQGLFLGLLLGGSMNVLAYFFSDRIALATMRAREVSAHDAPELVAIVEELASQARLPLPRVFICPQESPNAFATGRNPRHAVVAVTRGLLQALNRQELRGVIGHELAHIKHRDILIQTVAATVAGAISALAYVAYFIPMGSSSNDDRRGGNPLVALLLIILAPLAATMIQLAISRKREYNADNYGAELAGDPMFLATALEKLHLWNRRLPMHVPMPSQKSMFIVEPFLGRDAADWFNTHPSLARRLKALIGRESTGRAK